MSRIPDYFDVLAYLHEARRPRTYLEIGVSRGDSLRLAREDSICVGVDPEPLLQPGNEQRCCVERMTSDAFFAGNRPRELFGDTPLDLVFIDGMHLFEFALRDFFNSEALASPESLIVLHDCLPWDATTASRVRQTETWTGDIWKTVLCLLDHRQDLQLTILDIPPTGLALVRHLNPADRTLSDQYDALLAEYLDLGFDTWEARSEDVLQQTATIETEYWSLLREYALLEDRAVLLEDRCAQSEATIATLHASTSWRLTGPLRRLGDLVHRYLRPSG